MSDIKEFMTQDHRDCDDIFVEMENAVASKSDEALSKFEAFQDALTNHFKMEEMVLFPMFEQKTGMSEGPTQVMVMEHEQMRKLISEMEDAVESNDNDKFFGLSETLMILMQQHNMKEEQMLYTMIQQHLGEDADHNKVLNEARYAEMEWRNRKEAEALRGYIEEEIIPWLDQHIKAMDTPMADFLLQFGK